MAERLGMEADSWTARASRLHLLVVAGRFAEALAEAARILGWASDRDEAWTRVKVLTCVAQVEVHTGGTSVDVVELAGFLRTLWGPASLGMSVTLAHARGDLGLACELLVECAESATGHQPSLATEAAELGLLDLAEDLLSRGEPRTPADQAHHTTAAAVVARARGRVADAVVLLSECERMFLELEMLVGRAHALQRLGACLLHLGASARAGICLKEAQELWERFGATRRITEIDELLLTAS
jgi:hypothetical protein